MNSGVKFFLSLFIHTIVLWCGSLLTRPAIATWYQYIEKPFYTPPNFIFPIVWPILFLLLTISFWFIWKKYSFTKNKKVFVLYAIHLLLNIGWSFCFFFLNSPILGLIEMIILQLSVFLTFLSFLKIDKVASYLLIPYLIWLEYAFAINIGIVILN